MPDTLSLPSALPVHRSDREGKFVHAFGDTIIFKLTGTETEDRLTLWINITPPGGGPPPHYHTGEDETFLVQEGEVEFFIDGQWKPAAVGSVVFAPRNGIHTFRNVGKTSSRMLIFTQPSGFENFFMRCAEEFARTGGPDMDRIVAISAEHGIHFVTPAPQP
jgi:quercetin dioxygenase-like cupin family protein